MKNAIYVKNNGVVSEIHSASVVENKIQNKDCHLCSECSNGYPSMCSKVADIHKKEISDYEFITDGFQAFDNNGDSKFFIVERCNNYVSGKDMHNNKKGQLSKLKKLKHQLAAYYFDTETFEEAYLLQAELVERGHLKLNKKDLPDSRTLDNMRQRVKKKL